MQDLKKSIGDKITANRPKLGTSSVKTYVSILSNIYKQMDGDGGIEFFIESVKQIIEHLDKKNNQTKKTSLSALYVLTKKEDYREAMMTVMNEVNATYKEQKKTAKQEQAWMSAEEVKAIYQAQLANAVLMLSRKQMFSEAKFIQFLLVAFLSGAAGIPPRRSMDYGEMKVRNYNPKVDNYYKAGMFYFNKYKTSGTYGLQTLDVPKQLNTILKRWIKLNPTDYMLYSTNKQKLSSPQINRILNNAFDGNISTSMLRHIYLTDHYKNVPAIADMEELAQSMGHSVSQAMEYAKKN